MTSATQWEANRKNARKSTGPRTEKGRKRVALNAQRHGLSSRPLAEKILAHLRQILGDPCATVEAANSTADGQVALALALAEARLDRVRQIAANTEFLTPHADVQETVELLKEFIEDEDAKFTYKLVAHTFRDRLLTRSGRADRSDLRALARHVREAHGARSRALRKWLEFHKIQNKAIRRSARQI